MRKEILTFVFILIFKFGHSQNSTSECGCDSLKSQFLASQFATDPIPKKTIKKAEKEFYSISKEKNKELWFKDVERMIMTKRVIQ